MTNLPLGPNAGTVVGATHCSGCQSLCHRVREDDGITWQHATWHGLSDPTGVRHLCLTPDLTARDEAGYLHIGVVGGVLLFHPDRTVNASIRTTARAVPTHPPVVTVKAA